MSVEIEQDDCHMHIEIKIRLCRELRSFNVQFIIYLLGFRSLSVCCGLDGISNLSNLSCMVASTFLYIYLS